MQNSIKNPPLPFLWVLGQNRQSPALITLITLILITLEWFHLIRIDNGIYHKLTIQ